MTATPTVLYEDRWLVALAKPTGMPTQPDAERRTPDAATWVERRYGQAFLHHRLDQPVSGVLVIAIDPAANPALAAAFRDRLTIKTYAAVVAGQPPAERWTWDRPIDGRTARTEGRAVGTGSGLVATLLHPVTGRTHQLRRHAAAAGLPIVGDRRYGGDAGGWLDRLALHALRIELPHPMTGRPLTLTAPLPPDLAEVWEAAGGPAEVIPRDG